MRFFGPTDLEALAGMAQVELGAHDRSRLAAARQSLGSALAARGQDMARSRTFELTALAVAALRDGDDEVNREVEAIAAQGLGYERLDQLTTEVLLGAR